MIKIYNWSIEKSYHIELQLSNMGLSTVNFHVTRLYFIQWFMTNLDMYMWIVRITFTAMWINKIFFDKKLLFINNTTKLTN